jgi:ubiquinone/menaquinone biosynthesis C-methylase UbiE
MISRKRTFKLEKLARVYDEEILPVWSQRFGRMLLRDLELPDRCQVLDLACATGYPALDIIKRLGAGSRFIAIDPSSALLDVARRKVEEMGAKGVFFRSEQPGKRLPFADDVYDLVVCNLGLGDMPDRSAALVDYARVTVPGGEVRCTLPLEGTFEEFHDIYREVLIKHDKLEALARLEEHIAASYPSAADCEAWLKAARLTGGQVESERFTMLFRSSREFFFAPVIEFGPLSSWKEIAGTGQEMQDIFWYIKESIDAYFEGRAFAVTVVAGSLRGRKSLAAAKEAAEIYEPARPTEESPPMRAAVAVVSAIAEPTLEESPLPELPDTVDGAAPAPRGPGSPDTEQEIEIEAFVEGRPRPKHLEE